MKRFEIWASFEDGITAKVETHKSMKSAKIAIDAMNHANKRDIAEGYGFTHGVPVYTIKERTI
jgi:hypothetical protein